MKSNLGKACLNEKLSCQILIKPLSQMFQFLRKFVFLIYRFVFKFVFFSYSPNL